MTRSSWSSVGPRPTTDASSLSHEIVEQLERAEMVEAQVAAGVQRLPVLHLSHEIVEQLERAEMVEAARM